MGLSLPLRTSRRSEGDPWVEPLRDLAQLQLRFVDHRQWRYEVLRPFVLFADDTAAHRAEATRLQPDTGRRLTRRCQQQGMLGLLPDHTEPPRARSRGCRSDPTPGPL
jgi:hypothetical protein